MDDFMNPPIGDYATSDKHNDAQVFDGTRQGLLDYIAYLDIEYTIPELANMFGLDEHDYASIYTAISENF